MAKKIKFSLSMKNGVKVRSSIEELRENFDLDLATQYFLDGKLITWLEDRFYEEEADNLRKIDKNSPQLKQEICSILGVEYTDNSGLDVEQLERLNEKKRLLQEKTDDINIIANADKTAFHQDDLAELLDAGATTIYLCGENFSIPLKVNNVTYIGILGMPFLKVAASSQADLDKRNITVTNAKLPWTKEELPAYEPDNESSAKSPEPKVSSEEITPPPPPPPAPRTNPAKEKANTLLQMLKGSGEYSTDQLVIWSLPYPGLGYMETYADSKSELKSSIRSAGAEFENELRMGIRDTANQKLDILERIQASYDDLFRVSSTAYMVPSPSLQDVAKAMQNTANQVSSNISGIADALLRKAQIDSSREIGHFSDLFSSECSLENFDELIDYADNYFDKICRQCDHSEATSVMRSYLSSIIRGTERLAR